MAAILLKYNPAILDLIIIINEGSGISRSELLEPFYNVQFLSHQWLGGLGGAIMIIFNAFCSCNGRATHTHKYTA